MNRLLLTTFAACLLWPALPARAQASLADIAYAFAQREASAAAPAGATRVEVTLGQLDARLAQAGCARFEPFVPPGVRLWGRAHVGLRCADAGSTWSMRVPVTVRIHGTALVAARPLAPLEPVALEDLRAAEVELTREAHGVVTDAAQLDNRVPTRAIGPGQPIPLAALRAPQVIGRGDPVKVVGQGRGFAVAVEAVALAAAQDGQAVRVRTESGRILTGTARAGRVVEVVF